MYLLINDLVHVQFFVKVLFINIKYYFFTLYISLYTIFILIKLNKIIFYNNSNNL